MTIAKAAKAAKAMATKKKSARSRGGEAELLLEGLIGAAIQGRERAYAPYSRYRVGAALLTKSGQIFIGCNVENSTYGATICAERTAVVKMIAAGEREPIACVVVTGGPEPGSPCGICRQVLFEFASDMRVVLISQGARGIEKRKDTTLAELLPDGFRLKVTKS